MTFNFSYYILLRTLFLASVSWAVSATAQPSDPRLALPEPKTVGIDILYLGEDMPEPFLIWGDKLKRKIRLLPGTSTQFLNYAGTGSVFFYREPPAAPSGAGVIVNPSPETPEKPAPLLAFMPPPGAKRLLLLLAPSGKPEAPFSHVIIPVTESSWPQSDIMIWNTTTDELLCAIGSRRVTLESGVRKNLNISSVSNPFTFKLAGMHEGKMQLLFSTAVNGPGMGRQLVLVRKNDESNGSKSIIQINLPSDIQRMDEKGQWKDSLY